MNLATMNLDGMAIVRNRTHYVFPTRRPPPMTYFGLLNIDKPAGITSRKVVDAVAKLVRPEKAGHAGTLDPLATGVLVVCVGKATRLIEYVQRQHKTYLATFLLGRHSDTEDIEGTVTVLESPPIPSLDSIRRAAESFIGTILQRPPAFSALKVQGQRSYDLARAGEIPELKPRPVEIHSIEIVQYDYPGLTLRIGCGSGTYIRSLGRDLAEKLGTAAVMSALERTAIGEFHVEDALPLDQLTPENLRENLLPPLRAVPGLPIVKLNEAQQRRLLNGLPLTDVVTSADSSAELAAVDAAGNLVAILRVAPDGLRPVVNLGVPSSEQA